MSFAHGYDEMNKIKTPPFLKEIGLSEHGRNYVFQGTGKQIFGFMKSRPDLKLRGDPTKGVVIDVYDIALSASQQYQKAVVAAVPGINLIAALVSAFKSSRMKIRLTNGKVAPPVTGAVKVRLQVKTGTPLPDLAEAIAVALAGGGGKASHAMAIGVTVAKTGLKILKAVA